MLRSTWSITTDYECLDFSPSSPSAHALPPVGPYASAAFCCTSFKNCAASVLSSSSFTNRHAHVAHTGYGMATVAPRQTDKQAHSSRNVACR
jgi:hypothetical protein